MLKTPLIYEYMTKYLIKIKSVSIDPLVQYRSLLTNGYDILASNYMIL